MLHQLLARAHQFFDGVGGKAVEDEVGVARGGGQGGAAALSPVPAAAGDARAIGEDDFSRFGIGDNRFSIFCGIKRFVSDSKGQNEVALQAVQVFSANGQHVRDADGVVHVYDVVDGGQVVAFQ